MAEEAAIGAAIDQFVKLVGPPIKRFFIYLCCFSTNINNLKDEAKKLDDAAEGVRMKVNRALDAVETILPEVDTLLNKDYKEIKAQMTTILDEEADVRSGCLKIGARFSLSKRAYETAESMEKIKEECRKYSSSGTGISLPGSAAATKQIQLGDAYEFESRKKIEEDIMTVLRGGDVSMIGIYGMGGLGKTTMANRIRNRVLDENVFDETVIAVISQQVDKKKIQLEIGGQLSLELNEASSEDRKDKLRARLSGKKKILLVLDDVWKPIKLEEFGIPRDSKSCTILITSRKRDVMDVENKFGMEILSDEDARILFREKVGTCMDDAKIKVIAEGIVKKCGGLPIALVTVGAALKGKATVHWENALRELSQRRPDHIGDYSEEVYYKALRLSYNFLESEQDKSIFLLCCLFPEDAKIDVEKLTCFSMGLGIVEDIEDLEKVRNSVIVSIDTLKDLSLLLDGEKSDDHVRMHDVVRDVCILIAKEKKIIDGNDCQWISFFEPPGERTKLPTGLGSPNLRLLFLSRDYYSKEEAVILDNDFFEGNSGLSVLSIEGYQSLTSLPNSLKNLKSLSLESCNRLEEISVVGEFVNLEILICRECRMIKELPLAIKKLDRLKLLDLFGCLNLKRIGHGIISSLLGLEELKMLQSFNRWESEETGERKNAGIRELEALTNLRSLEIEIQDPALAAEVKHLSSKIKRFLIKIGTDAGGFDYSYKNMVLKLQREEPRLGDSILMQLLRDTEFLYLRGNGANRVDLAKCQNIRRLHLKECETMKNIITTSMVDDAEHLFLQDLPRLQVIYDGPISSNSFHNLKALKLSRLVALKQLWKSSSQNIDVPPRFTNLYSIHITGCDRLCNLELLSMAGKDCLPQLEEIEIGECEMMEQVFLWNKEDEIRNDDHCITKVFSKLKKVHLSHLPNLATFYQGMGAMKFPLLTELSILECPELKSMGSNLNSEGSSMDINDDSSQHLFCRPNKLSFGNLKELSLRRQWNPFCGHKIPFSQLNRLEKLRLYKLFGGRSLFSSSVAGNLVNLRILQIEECDQMLKVIEENKEEDEMVVSGAAEMPLILFPKLEKLELRNLPKLVTFCELECNVKLPLILFPKLEKLRLRWLPKLVTFCELECNVQLPSLRKVTILGCPDMENLSLGLIAAPSLEAFKTNLKISNLENWVNVSFNSLKKLEIGECEVPFCRKKFFISIFNGLKELKVREGSMSCLFTSSIARHLDNLQVLTIRECNEMVKVIEDEESGGDEENKEEDEKVVSGTALILFPKLEKLELWYSPKLVTFCELECNVKLPSLRDLVIEGCDVFRTFTMGSIAAPNLERVQIDSENIGVGTKDLNIVVHQKYMAREEEQRQQMYSGEEEDEEGEEEEKEKKEEIKGEIEEEGQN